MAPEHEAKQYSREKTINRSVCICSFSLFLPRSLGSATQVLDSLRNETENCGLTLVGLPYLLLCICNLQFATLIVVAWNLYLMGHCQLLMALLVPENSPLNLKYLESFFYQTRFGIFN